MSCRNLAAGLFLAIQISRPRLPLPGRLDPRRDRRVHAAPEFPARQRPPHPEGPGFPPSVRVLDRRRERPRHRPVPERAGREALVKLVITPSGTDSFSVGRASHKATRYVVKVEIGGLVGLLAKLLGKVPPDTSVWILQGEAPAFVKSEGPLYSGGPVWRIELASPVWARAAVAAPARPTP